MSKLETLTEKFPLLFTTADHEPFTLFGFECGDGWYNIIAAACNCIYHEFRQAQRDVAHYSTRIQEINQPGPELDLAKSHLQKSILRLDTCQQSLPKFVQIKEKFGGLCMYYDGGNEFSRGVISMAEVVADVTCQTCGSVAVPVPGSWRKQCTVCK